MAYLKILDNHGNKIPASQFMSAYEAAGTGRRLSNWDTSSMGPNSAIFGSLSSIRSRSRNLVMNTPQASGAIDSFVSNMIGQGITPRWQLDDRDLKEKKFPRLHVSNKVAVRIFTRRTRVFLQVLHALHGEPKNLPFTQRFNPREFSPHRNRRQGDDDHDGGNRRHDGADFVFQGVPDLYRQGHGGGGGQEKGD